MLDYLLLEPARHGRPSLGWFRFWQLMQDRTNGAFSEKYVRLARTWRPPVTLPRSDKLPASGQDTLLSELRREGCALLPFRLSPDDIRHLRAFAFSTPAYSANLNERIAIREDAVPTARAMYRWRTADLIADPTVQRLVLQGPFASIAQDYLGCRPLLSTLTLWLNPSYPGGNDQFVYHYDNDGPKFLKFFIYLSDMDVGTGAHYFVRGSHAPRKPAQFARSRRVNSDILLDHFGRNSEYVAAGPAGTILAEDTNGFHRGSAMTSGYRLMLQLQYSLIDIATEEDLARDYRPQPVAGLEPSTAKVHAKFWRSA